MLSLAKKVSLALSGCPEKMIQYNLVIVLYLTTIYPPSRVKFQKRNLPISGPPGSLIKTN